MNLMIQPNQICLIVKLYNNRPELLPDSNDIKNKNRGLVLEFPGHKYKKIQFAFKKILCLLCCKISYSREAETCKITYSTLDHDYDEIDQEGFHITVRPVYEDQGEILCICKTGN